MSSVFQINHKHMGLGKFRKERPQKARAIMDKAAVVIRDEQKRRCRIRTGALVNSIHIENRGVFEIAIVEGTDTINYGWFLNKGTRRGITADHHIDLAIIAGLRFLDEELKKFAKDVN